MSPPLTLAPGATGPLTLLKAGSAHELWSRSLGGSMQPTILSHDWRGPMAGARGCCLAYAEHKTRKGHCPIEQQPAKPIILRWRPGIGQPSAITGDGKPSLNTVAGTDHQRKERGGRNGNICTFNSSIEFILNFALIQYNLGCFIFTSCFIFSFLH